MGVEIAIAGALIGAGIGAWSANQQAQMQKNMSKGQRDLMRQQIASNRRHAGDMHAITMERIGERRDQIDDYRATATFGRDQQLSGIDLAREDLSAQRGLARTEFGQAMDQLYDARQRARGSLHERGAAENVAGASFGSRGGSSQAVMAERLTQDSEHMEQMGEWEETGLNARWDAAQTGFQTQGARLSLSQEAAMHQYGMQMNELDRAERDTDRERRGAWSALQNADAGWNYQLGMADLQVNHASQQAQYAPWMGGMQGAAQGFQLGANVYSFGSENSWFSGR